MSSTDYTDNDSLSDSDWLDVASNPGSDSPHSPSRRSSISFGSDDPDGGLDAWEGFAAAVDDDDDPEDHQVSAALDQSLVGTLAGSRSPSHEPPSTAANSVRDLRLSFPDPLSSSGEELPTRRTIPLSLSAGSSSQFSDDSGDSAVVVPDAPPSKESEVTHPASDNAPYQIYIYGSDAQNKWSIVADIIAKSAAATSLDVSHTPDTRTRYYRVDRATDDPCLIPVHDRTSGNSGDKLDAPSAPSLALILLPSSLSSIPDHSFYLPIYLDSELDLASSGLPSPYTSWRSLRIPPQRRLSLTGYSDLLVNSNEIPLLDPSTVKRALSPLIANSNQDEDRVDLGTIKRLALLSLTSVLLACLVSVAFRSTAAPTPTVQQSTSHSGFWDMLKPAINHSSATKPTAEANMAIIPSSLKDFALSVINPITSPPSSPNPKKAHSAEDIKCSTGLSKLIDLPTKPSSREATTDVIVRPPSTVSIKPSVGDASSPSPTAASSKSLSLISTSTKALSIHLADVSTLFKSVSVPSDLQDLQDALDGLMSSIARQTDGVKESFEYRHGRARGRAKELRARGMEMMESAKETVRARASRAQSKARTIKRRFEDRDAKATERESKGWGFVSSMGFGASVAVQEEKPRRCKSRNRDCGRVSFF